MAGTWFLVGIAAMAYAAAAVADSPTASPILTPSAAAAGDLRELRVRLTDFSTGLPQKGQWRNGLSVADLNADGHLDIAHGPPRKGPPRPVVFLGDGAGHWQLWRAARFPDLAYAYGDAAVADFDADGHADIALAMHERGVVLLLGDGLGRFEASRDLVPTALAGAGTFGTRALAVAELNGDRRPDVIALGEGMSRPIPGRGGAPGGGSMGLALFLSRPDGIWQRQFVGAEEGSFGDALAVGDANGDGRVDVLIGSHRSGDREVLYMGEAGGRFRATAVGDLQDGAYVDGVCMGEVDRDAGADLVLGYVRFAAGAWHSELDLFTGGRDGRWQRRSLASETSPRGVTALACGDLDADGALDIVGLTGDGDMWILFGDGAGGFRRAAIEGRAATGCRGYSVALADLTGDGRAEIFAGSAGETSAFAPGTCPGEGRLEVWQARRDL